MPSLSVKPMHVRGIGVYRGPHLYSATPMVRIELDLGTLEDWPSDRLDGFTDLLLRDLPGLEAHGCCHGVPGGFVRRLREAPGWATWPSMSRWSCSRAPEPW